MTRFVLAWYDKGSDYFLDDITLDKLSEGDVRKLFKLKKGEYPGDCLPVLESAVKTIAFLEKEYKVKINHDRYDYFVEYLA